MNLQLTKPSLCSSLMSTYCILSFTNFTHKILTVFSTSLLVQVLGEILICYRTQNLVFNLCAKTFVLAYIFGLYSSCSFQHLWYKHYYQHHQYQHHNQYCHYCSYYHYHCWQLYWTTFCPEGTWERHWNDIRSCQEIIKY